MEIVQHIKDEQVVVGGSALVPVSKLSNLKFVTKQPSAFEPPDAVIEDLVHEIENLKKKEALARVSKLEDTHEVTYFKMGGILSVINNNKWFDPYESFDEWVENKTAMKRAKARALIQNYDAVVNSGITGAQVKGISWTKLRVIARILTKDNVLDWVEKASLHTRKELKELVKGHLVASGGSLPVNSKVTPMTFKPHEDQKATIDAAIEKAKAASGTDIDTVALEYVCLDYLGGGHTMAQRLQAVGPAQAGKATKQAFSAPDVLAQFVKAFGALAMLHAIEKAEPTWAIDVTNANEVDVALAAD